MLRNERSLARPGRPSTERLQRRWNRLGGREGGGVDLKVTRGVWIQCNPSDLTRMINGRPGGVAGRAWAWQTRGRVFKTLAGSLADGRRTFTIDPAPCTAPYLGGRFATCDITSTAAVCCALLPVLLPPPLLRQTVTSLKFKSLRCSWRPARRIKRRAAALPWWK